MAATRTELRKALLARAYGMGDIRLGRLLGHYPPQVPVVQASSLEELREALRGT